jgi:flagellar assembly factor FliW
MKMSYDTVRSGMIGVNPEEIIRIPAGPIGFPDYKEFVLIVDEYEYPFRTFQSLEDPAFAFIVVNPVIARQDYKVDVTANDLKQIEAGTIENVDVYVTVNMHEDLKQTTVNLKAPFLINTKKQIGYQYIVPNEKYQKKEPFLQSND